MDNTHLTDLKDYKRFLDENGYVVLKGILTPEEVTKTKQKLQSIYEIESPRNGEFGYSILRERLIEKNSRFKLFVLNFLFRTLRFFIQFLLKVFPQAYQLLLQYRIKPYDYSKSSPLKIELRQMIISITEQIENPQDMRVCDLANKGEEFDVFYHHETIHELLRHVIGNDFKLSSLNHRSPQKNGAVQDMHVDFPWAVRTGDYYACNALFALDDMDASNGATRVVPKSHKWAKMPYEDMQDLKAPHPDEVIINAKAGDVLFLNGHVWHGGTLNKTGKARGLIQSYFVHRAHPPQQHQRFQLRDETRNRLDKKTLDLLDVPESSS